MSLDRSESLFFELFSGLPRQGPGSAASTRRALQFVPHLNEESQILDVGCGTGAQTFVLSESTSAHIVAVDNHAPYIDVLHRKVCELNLTDRIQTLVADMRNLKFANEAFELIWCEGAIYNIGVETALREWRQFLTQDGHIVFTEVCWRHHTPPEPCKEFWAREYPDIGELNALLAAVESSGYSVVEHFPLNADAWWDGYYRPLQTNIADFRDRYRDARDAQELADRCQHEIEIWQMYSDYYGYEFCICRAN